MEIYANIYLISAVLVFSCFSHDFIMHINFTRIAAPNTGTDMSQIRSHIEYLK